MAAITTPTTTTTGVTQTPVVVPRRRSSALPYVLLLPSVVVLGVMLGYPLVRLVTMSLQEYGLPQVFGQPAPWVGLDNFRTILEDDYFWTVLWRTLLFCFVNVALTMVLGVLIALLLDALGKAHAAVRVGVVDRRLGDAGADRHDRLAVDVRHRVRPRQLGARPAGRELVGEPADVLLRSPRSSSCGWASRSSPSRCTPRLTQIPEDIVEAAKLDGAGFRDIFRYVAFPALKPILLILTALSVIWDFRVFTQIYVLQRAGGITRDTNLLGVFAYRISIGENRFDIGAAVAVVMVAITALLTVVYLRAMVKSEQLA